MEKHLIHNNELHLINKDVLHKAVKLMVDELGLAAGSTADFDLYKVVETYFIDREKRQLINEIIEKKEE